MRRRRTKRLLAAAFIFFGVSLALGQTAAHPANSPLATAKAQLDHDDLEASEKSIWTVLSSAPDDPEALTLLGIVRGRQNRFAEAEALFRRALQLNPKAVVASRNLASALLAQDKPDDAIRQYDQTIRLSPQDSDLKMEVARLELQRGKFAEALSTLDAAKPARLGPAAIPLKAASLLGLDRKADAEALIPMTKGRPDAALDLAQVFVAAGDPGAALKALSLLNPVPKRAAARVAYLKGRALRQQGDRNAAMASFRQALAADPKSLETMLAMGELFSSENKYSDSLAMLQKARSVAPDSLEVLRHLIVELMHAGQNDRGLEAAQDLQRKSSALDDRYLVASVMLQQKQFQPASHILEDYVTERPEDAKGHLGLGLAYVNMLRYAEAQKALERALEINPGLAEAEHQLGLLASQQGDRQGAIQHWQRAVALKPDHARALFYLGTMYLESGDVEKAEADFKGSLAADPNNMKTEYDLSLVLNKLGKSAEAKQHFDRYMVMKDAEHISGGNPPAPDHP
jgi:tetratricopeptide (TPR) repeat protein